MRLLNNLNQDQPYLKIQFKYLKYLKYNNFLVHSFKSKNY